MSPGHKEKTSASKRRLSTFVLGATRVDQSCGATVIKIYSSGSDPLGLAYQGSLDHRSTIGFTVIPRPPRFIPYMACHSQGFTDTSSQPKLSMESSRNRPVGTTFLLSTATSRMHHGVLLPKPVYVECISRFVPPYLRHATIKWMT
ncbi:hypothetical protein M404DRAFT_751079 [Pisolithus tinctorius Marx 270]|uniref:Uncharacterized protein n=1 Tax=Pisolithus tinctorius Marx 270 TaxID=870435 RepID=A0A0C3PU44_PISTI|nr:hypothetical protein M404DRAFT_751079 [Pisolithus tinctorius Marx 270]